MARVKIDWNMPAFEQIRRLPAVSTALASSAERIATACGDGFHAEAGQGRSRARASVIAASGDARRRNARENTILRNVNQGGI